MNPEPNSEKQAEYVDVSQFDLKKFKRTLLQEALDMHSFLVENPGRDDAYTVRFKAAESALDAASAALSMWEYAAMVEACGGQQSLMDWLEVQLGD